MVRSIALVLGVAAFLTARAPATAFADRGDVSPLADLLQIVVRPRSLLAIDGSHGGQREERLERGENLVWHAARGRVGVVLTDRRVLAVATGSAAWQEERWRSAERRPVERMENLTLALKGQNKRTV